jgi:hypothetical protein
MSLHLLGSVPMPKADDAPPSATGFFLFGGGEGVIKSQAENSV